MKEYDLDSINNVVQMEDICDRFGIPTQHKGGRIFVLCPFHSDEHFGSAMIWQNKISCFACPGIFSIYDVYMLMRNCSFSAAVEAILADFGLGAQYVTDQKSRRFPISKDELRLLGMERKKQECYVIGSVHANEKNEGTYIQKRDGEFFTVKKGKSYMFHLRELYEEDVKTFKWLIANKCNEAYHVYWQNFCLFRAVNDALLEKGVTDQVNNQMLMDCMQAITQVKNIYKKVKEL